jgi:DUF4097 and DUF4098 domain-containing protein YvlB
MLRTRQCLALLLCLSSLAAFAEQETRKNNQSRLSSEGSVPGSAALHVKIEGGSIRLEGYSGDRISYLVRSISPASPHRSEQDLPQYKIASYVRGTTSWLVATPRNERSGLRAIEFLVRVPQRVRSVNLDTSGGDVNVHNVGGRVSIVSGGGSLYIDDVDGMVSASTGGQDIDVGTVEGDARFRTGGGKISIRKVKGNLDAFTGGGAIFLGTGMRNAFLESGAGDIHVSFCGGELKVQSGGGNLILGDVQGPANIRTNGGNLQLRSAKGFVQAHTTAGNIELDGVPGADASSEVGSIVAKFEPSSRRNPNSLLKTAIGDITVFLPADIAITVRASVALGKNHTINSDIPGISIASEGTDWSSSLTAEGKLNGGGAVLEVHTGDGNINFKRLDR